MVTRTLLRGLFLALSLVVPVLGATPVAPITDAQLKRVFPEATRFGRLEGKPPAVAAYAGDRLLGYAFSSLAVVGSTGYSGKPIDVLVGLGVDGRVTGAVLRAHHEPILVIGVAEKDLFAFVDSFRGMDVRRGLRIGPGAGAASGRQDIDAISGATVSSIVIADAILRAARIVGRSRGLLARPGGRGARLDIDRFEKRSWPDLRRAGLIARLRVSNGDVAAKFSRIGVADADTANPKNLFVELFTALVTPAMVGRNLLGHIRYNRLLAKRKPGEHYIFIAANGRYSFKGTGWVRSGRFDRIRIVQGDKTLRLTKAQHQRIEKLAIAKAPELREAALFRIPASAGFDPTAPWRLDLLVGQPQAAGDPPRTVRFSLIYTLPTAFVIRLRSVWSTAKMEAATIRDLGSDSSPLWRNIWRQRVGRIAVLMIALAVLTAILFLQGPVVRRPRLYRVLRTLFLAFTLLWLGLYAGAQLSVVNVLTFVQALLSGFQWNLFLLEPLIFILWGYVAVAMLFWGRGVFCGWLCPFGALQELLSQGARALRVPQIVLPFGVHERLWPIKYVIFLGLFALSLGAMGYAVRGAEVEPFKTVLALKFARAWPFVLYALAVLGMGLFLERFFCRYLCPLGGALAIPARLRMFDWLRRRPQCGTLCQACAVDCTVQAIHPDGRINPNECIHCLNCQVIYLDDHRCPPLIERRKRRERRLVLSGAGEGGDHDAGSALVSEMRKTI